jgi:energy-coupling factor transporter ATP-binding protein EcfA2
MENNAQIAISHFTYAYPEQPDLALRNVDLEIGPGQFVAIMGPNGAGKSTLCMSINGVIPNVMGGRMGGNCRVVGLDTREHHIYEIAEHVGIVLQGLESQLLTSRVRSEVAFAAENLGMDREEMERRVEWALSEVRLTEYVDHSPDELSGGQKQRLAIASALVTHPPILVLDEPTSQLDPIGTKEVLTLLEKLNRDRGMTIVIATHKSEEIAGLADRIVLLNHGEVVAQGTPSEIFSRVGQMTDMGLKVPAITQIEWMLQDDLKNETLSVTIDEGIRRLSDVLQKRRNDGSSNKSITGESSSNSRHGDPVIEFQDVSYRYPATEKQALQGVSTSIGKGEFVGVMGHNGSGKTTLVKHIVGLLQASQGHVLLKSRDVNQQNMHEIVKEIGLVLQNPDTQLFSLSVAEEVAFGPNNLGMEKEQVQKSVDAALLATGLDGLRDVYPFNLSFGDRRKLSVAAVLSMQPETLIFDEPTTGQDYLGRKDLAEIGLSLNGEGKTVLMVTHDMDLIAAYTQRLVVLNEGEILLDGPTSEVFQQTEALKRASIQAPQTTRIAQALGRFDIPGNILDPELLADTIRKKLTE